MSRPAPNILRNYDVGLKRYEVLEADDLFVVTFQGKPIGMRIVAAYVNAPPKYKRTAFVNRGHADRLAKQLNTACRTDQFAVQIINL